MLEWFTFCSAIDHSHRGAAALTLFDTTCFLLTCPGNSIAVSGVLRSVKAARKWIERFQHPNLSSDAVGASITTYIMVPFSQWSVVSHTSTISQHEVGSCLGLHIMSAPARQQNAVQHFMGIVGINHSEVQQFISLLYMAGPPRGARCKAWLRSSIYRLADIEGPKGFCIAPSSYLVHPLRWNQGILSPYISQIWALLFRPGCSGWVQAKFPQKDGARLQSLFGSSRGAAFR